MHNYFRPMLLGECYEQQMLKMMNSKNMEMITNPKMHVFLS
jgi:hypothetical protein